MPTLYSLIRLYPSIVSCLTSTEHPQSTSGEIHLFVEVSPPRHQTQTSIVSPLHSRTLAIFALAIVAAIVAPGACACVTLTSSVADVVIAHFYLLKFCYAKGDLSGLLASPCPFTFSCPTHSCGPVGGAEAAVIGAEAAVTAAAGHTPAFRPTWAASTPAFPPLNEHLVFIFAPTHV